MEHTRIIKLTPAGSSNDALVVKAEEHSYAHGKRKHRRLGLKKLWKGVKKYNPASVAVRNGALLGFDLNVLGNSMRLYPALLTPEQAKAEGVKVEAIAKAKPAWEKTKKFWEKFGGDISKLEKAIRRGAKHKITKLKKKHGADGAVEYYFDDTDYSNVVGTAAVAAGSAVLIGVAGIIAKSGAMKQPFEEKDEQSDRDDESTGNEDTSNESNESSDNNDDSSSADGTIHLTSNKIVLTGIVVGSIAGLAYALKNKQNLKDTLGYTVAGGLIGYGVQHIVKNVKTN